MREAYGNGSSATSGAIGIGARGRSTIALVSQFLEDPSAFFRRPSERRRATLFVWLTVGLVVVGALLAWPALEHVLRISLPPTGRPFLMGWILLAVVLVKLVSVATSVGVIFGLVLMVRAIGKFAGGVGQYWCAVCAIASVQFGLGSLVAGAIALCVGAPTFSSFDQLATIVPSAASIVAGADGKLREILLLVEPFRLWTFVLFTIAFARLGGARLGYAALAALVVVIVPNVYGLIR